MKTVEETELQMKQEEIAARAMHLWEQTGHHHHHDLEIWLEAEAKLGAAAPTCHARGCASELDSVRASVECVEDMLAPAW